MPLDKNIGSGGGMSEEELERRAILRRKLESVFLPFGLIEDGLPIAEIVKKYRKILDSYPQLIGALEQLSPLIGDQPVVVADKMRTLKHYLSFLDDGGKTFADIEPDINTWVHGVSELAEALRLDAVDKGHAHLRITDL